MKLSQEEKIYEAKRHSLSCISQIKHGQLDAIISKVNPKCYWKVVLAELNFMYSKFDTFYVSYKIKIMV